MMMQQGVDRFPRRYPTTMPTSTSTPAPRSRTTGFRCFRPSICEWSHRREPHGGDPHCGARLIELGCPGRRHPNREFSLFGLRTYNNRPTSENHLLGKHSMHKKLRRLRMSYSTANPYAPLTRQSALGPTNSTFPHSLTRGTRNSVRPQPYNRGCGYHIQSVDPPGRYSNISFGFARFLSTEILM